LVWRAGWTGRARVWTRPACAPNAGDHVGANPVDRGKPGSKIHLACEGSGLPLTAVVTAANISDVTMLAAVLDDVPAVLTPAGRRRTRPGKLDADKGYDSAGNRAWLRRRGIRARIARRGIESSQRLGRHRWRVERALSWLSWDRRLQVRWDRGSERFFAFVLLACALVCCKRLEQPTSIDVLLGPGHPDRLVLQPDAAAGGGVRRPRLGDLGPHALLDLGRLGVDQRADRGGDVAQPPGGQLS
jgi:transposase